MIFSVAVATLVTLSAPASAFDPRVPQVAFNSAALQGYLNGVGESINCLTDQLDAQMWTTGISGNSTLTLMIELTGTAAGNAIGVYNFDDPNPVPALFQVFPGAASAGWYATAHFGIAGDLVVSLFDNNSIFQGQAGYLGVNRNRFGFYLQGPGGNFYSQDSRNGGNAQILTYAGTGANFGEWWQCFEDQPFAGSDKDFNDAVVIVESIAPTPAELGSWGRLKRLYR